MEEEDEEDYGLDEWELTNHAKKASDKCRLCDTVRTLVGREHNADAAYRARLTCAPSACIVRPPLLHWLLVLRTDGSQAQQWRSSKKKISSLSLFHVRPPTTPARYEMIVDASRRAMGPWSSTKSWHGDDACCSVDKVEAITKAYCMALVAPLIR